jgi:hypothetical protein
LRGPHERCCGVLGVNPFGVDAQHNWPGPPARLYQSIRVRRVSQSRNAATKPFPRRAARSTAGWDVPPISTGRWPLTDFGPILGAAYPIAGAGVLDGIRRLACSHGGEVLLEASASAG